MNKLVLGLVTGIVIFGLSAQLNGQTSQSKNQLPEIGIVASSAISLDKEMLIGDILMRQLRGQAPIINDPLLDEYIQDLGNRLVAQADDVKFPYTFFLINNQAINAFAFFGGHIGTHTGLIIQARNESELASVLAHEVSHVSQRHIARRIEAQQKSSPLQIASLLGGILLAAVNPEAGIAAITAGNAASAQRTINYTRQNEKEADRVGIRILAQAGFDPNGASSFFEILTAKNRSNSRPFAFLQTHPLPESRVADARTRAATYRPVNLAPSLTFHLARSRIIARYYATPSRNVEYFSGLLSEQRYVIKEAAQYGLALAYFANKQYAESQKLIDELLEGSPDNLFYIDTYTDLAVQSKQFESAIKILSNRAKLAPNNQVVTLNLANVYIQSEQYDQAVRLLKDFLLLNPKHLLAHELLSEAYQKNQQNLEMHQTKAEIYYLLAAHSRAIDSLQTAYTFSQDRKVERQRIRGRIDQLRAEQERLKAL